VEAARVLAETLLAESSGRTDDALARAFELLTSRRPDDEELAIMRRMHAEQAEWYHCRPEEAFAVVGIGDRKPSSTLWAADTAALAGVINALMNYDGCVVKR
jgi:hypothetical protein